jgi:hypothetical protein
MELLSSSRMRERTNSAFFIDLRYTAVVETASSLVGRSLHHPVHEPQKRTGNLMIEFIFFSAMFGPIIKRRLGLLFRFQN